MKKLLLGAITALAFLFGVASCSGDLHDKEVAKLDFGADYYLAGDMTDWGNGPLIQFTADESDVALFWAVFDATDTKQSFCFTKDADWTGQIGGNLITEGTLGKDITYESKDNGFGGFNAVLSGLTKGSTYKMVAKATDDGTIQIDCAESKAPNYFILDGYYLKGTFDGKDWDFDKKKVLMDGEKDTATGDVTYKVMFIATNTTEEGIIAKFDDLSFYGGVIVSAKDADPKTFSDSSEDNIKFTDLESGKGYFVYVVTSVDGTVKISIAEGANIQIVGVQVVGLGSDYTGKKLVFGGDQIGWPNDWDGTEATACEVNDGIATLILNNPIKLYKVGTVSILATVAGDWGKRLGAYYQENKGNGSIDISKVPLDYTSYIIYADVSGLNKDDEIEWQFIKPTVQIVVTGLPSAANGKELYFTGGFNDWKEPSKEGTYKVTVTDGSVSLVASVDANSEGKFASAGWARPEICALKADGSDGENIKWEGLSFGKTLKGVYSKTLQHKEGGDMYICTWSVE